MNIVNLVTYYYMLKKISVLVAYYVLFVNLPYDYSDVRYYLEVGIQHLRLTVRHESYYQGLFTN